MEWRRHRVERLCWGTHPAFDVAATKVSFRLRIQPLRRPLRPELERRLSSDRAGILTFEDWRNPLVRVTYPAARRRLPRRTPIQEPQKESMLDRSRFDSETQAAMDDIARLLHIKTAVSEMNETFKNSEGLDARRSKPSAKRVMRAARGAAEDLLKEAFVRKSSRNFREIQRRHLSDLLLALESATLLSRQEYAENPEVAGKGVLDQHVVRPLQELTERWKVVAHERSSDK
jgi:hypothetical protein